MISEEIFLLDLGWLGGDMGWFLPGGPGCAMTFSNRNPEKKWVEIPVSAALSNIPTAIFSLTPEFLLTQCKPTKKV